MSDLSAVEHAREAYIQTFSCDVETVRAGRMDWSPWIKGYAAAIQTTMHMRDSRASLLTDEQGRDQ